ncbi:MAG TPA: 2-isopropylmalate synthase [Armatimonadota bacterium]|jgi:2-isopropylmalate synthase
MSQDIRIFDTTLRDGEQSPGASLNMEQKLTIAHQLAALQVDVMEAGFPYSSPEDFESVSQIARDIHGPIICGLCRTKNEDIDACWRAIEHADKPRIHTFIGTSNIHIEKKLRKTKPEVLRMAVEAVKFARERCADVEFSAEDALRTDRDYLAEIVAATIEAGATTINIPDTVGYTMPWEMADTIRFLIENAAGFAEVWRSVHCHNDLGLAVANSLAAVTAGATQVECTINGLGERAGNAALEEVVMAIRTRPDLFDCQVGIRTPEIMKTSRMVSSFTGFLVQPNKAVVGANAFAHEAGIHQHGMIMDRTTYEIMKPEDVGLSESMLTLGPRSGRHGLARRLQELGYDVPEDKLDAVYQRFLAVADRKKQVYDEDLAVIMKEASAQVPETWHLVSLRINSGSDLTPTAAVRLEKEGSTFEEESTGNGPVDAAFMAIDKIVGLDLKLEDYTLRSVSIGKDALGESSVRIRANGDEAIGRAASTDVVEASARAYLNAINRLLVKGRQHPAEADPGV